MCSFGVQTMLYFRGYILEEEFPDISKGNFCTMERATLVEYSCPITNVFLKPKTYSVNNFIIQCIKWTRQPIILSYIRMTKVAEVC